MIWQRIISSAIVLPALLLGFSPAAHAGEVMQASSGIVIKVKSMKELREERVVIQKYDFSCGSAALATLLTYSYDKPVKEEDVFRAMYAVGDQPHIQKVGFSLLDMQKYLTSRGIHSDGYKVTLDQLRDLRMPAIALISPGGYHHFVVVRGWDGESILIADPQNGLHRMNASNFQEIWNGVIFVVSDDVALAQSRYNDQADEKVMPRAPYNSRNRGSVPVLLNLPALNEY